MNWDNYFKNFVNVHTVKGLANEKSRFLEIKLEQFYKESNSVQIFSIDDI